LHQKPAAYVMIGACAVTRGASALQRS
jgi:hypothetical protein